MNIRDWLSILCITPRVREDPVSDETENETKRGPYPLTEAERASLLAEAARTGFAGLRGPTGQASPMGSAMGSPMGALLGGVGQAPSPSLRPPVGASERDLQWVWEHLPAGSTIYLSIPSDMAALAPADGPPVEDVRIGLVPCLRAASLSPAVTDEANQHEAEAAVTLLSVLAYGETGKLEVVVLRRVAGP